MTANVYTGDIQIEDADFHLKANRLIVREDDLSLAFSGSDESGSFKTEGQTVKNFEGHQVAQNLPLEYEQYSDDDTATIVFKKLKRIEQNKKCYIEGFWKQDEVKWNFSATLNHYKPQT